MSSCPFNNNTIYVMFAKLIGLINIFISLYIKLRMTAMLQSCRSCGCCDIGVIGIFGDAVLWIKNNPLNSKFDVPSTVAGFTHK